MTIIRKHAILICVLFAMATPGMAEESPLPFSMPVPDGWRTETIPFPLEFAPDLPYVGLEELRFAPGMFKEGSDEFWTYAFVWWVEMDGPSDAKSLSIHLKDYFWGLSEAVAESREIEIGDATFSASLEAGDGETFFGTAETFDAFVTHDQVRLNIRGDVWKCPEAERQVIFFALSPQGSDHSLWTRLDSIRTGFRCSAQDDKK